MTIELNNYAIILPNGIGTLMYANQGCLCPIQGAAAAELFSPNCGLRNVCMDSFNCFYARIKGSYLIFQFLEVDQKYIRSKTPVWYIFPNFYCSFMQQFFQKIS